MKKQKQTSNANSARDNITAITACLRTLSAELKNKTAGKSTEIIKKAFGKLGERQNWNVCASSRKPNGKPRFESEWLLDLIWYRYIAKKGGKNKGLIIGLAIESEWSHHFSDLRYDFEKLIVIKSPYKVFIFQAKENDKDKFIRDLESAIVDCHHSSQNETYIFACWNLTKPGGFEIKIKKIPS